MKRKSIFLVLTVFLLLVQVFAGCDKDDNNNNGCQMSAKVDDVDFCGTGHYAHDPSTGVMTIQAAHDLKIIQITINNAAVGSFQFGLGTDAAGYSLGQDAYISISGTMTITKFENNTVEGTFNFVGELIGGGATKTVTNGSFSIPKI